MSETLEGKKFSMILNVPILAVRPPSSKVVILKYKMHWTIMLLNK